MATPLAILSAAAAAVRLFSHLGLQCPANNLNTGARFLHAIVVSLALQHGADLETIRAALTEDDGGGPATCLGAALEALVDALTSSPAPGTWD